MESEVLKLASTQGIWATLSIFLIFYILKTQEKRDTIQGQREQKYQEIISTLSERLNVIEEVKNDVQEIKKFVFTK